MIRTTSRMARAARGCLFSALTTLIVVAGASSASAMTVLATQRDSGRTLVLRRGGEGRPVTRRFSLKISVS